MLHAMKLYILTAGKPKSSFLTEGMREYEKHINRFAQVKILHTLEDSPSIEKVRKLCKQSKLILLDEKGKEMSSLQFADFLEKARNHSEDLCFFIGGPDGHSEAMKQEADMLFSLSPLTFPHDLATLVLLETLYRSLSILANHPYHRS